MNRYEIAKEYYDFIDAKLNSEKDASEFSAAFLLKMKGDNRLFDDDLYDILQSAFGDADAYTTDNNLLLSSPGYYLSGQEFYQNMLKNKNALLRLMLD